MSEAPVVAITGIGVVGPHGVGTELYWSGLTEGRSAIGPMPDALASRVTASCCGAVREFDPLSWIEKRAARRMGRFAQFALVATRLALADASIAELEPDRTGITIHTGAGGLPEGDAEVIGRRDDPTRTGPLYVPLVSANMAAANVSIALGVTGPVTAGVGACAAGAIGVSEGFWLLQRDRDVDVVLAGASDAALTPYLVGSLANAGALSTAKGDPATISRPFDLARTGFVPAEGAAMVVLERLDHARARGATVYATIAGAAIGSDAFHVTAPDPVGAGAERVLRAALAPGETGSGRHRRDRRAWHGHETE